LIIKSLVVGPIMANCFIFGCERTKKSVVIDPGDDSDKILFSLAEENLKVEHIINTHGHFDHVSANRLMKEATGADIIIHSLDAPMLDSLSSNASMFGLNAENSPPPDRTVDDGDVITFGDIDLKVIHTPGHTQGGISLYFDGHLFVGDTLFQGSIGRTDFPGGDYNTLISAIREKLFVLGDDVRVFPGHGPETSIGTERRSNPFAGMGSK